MGCCQRGSIEHIGSCNPRAVAWDLVTLRHTQEGGCPTFHFPLCIVVGFYPSYRAKYVLKRESIVVLETNSEFEFLQNEVSRNIQILKSKAKSNKRKTCWIHAISISLGALITVTLGVDVTGENIILQKNVALIFGSLLTIVSSWNACFDYKKLWVRQKTTLLALYQIKNELGYRASKDNKTQIDDIFDQYRLIWEQDSNEWRSITQSASISNKDSSRE
ncbi:hypothetical protein CF125_09845 [Aeromonas veronii]|nr:hypothetical protein CF125_09845 [Aeromonas veronii]